LAVLRRRHEALERRLGAGVESRREGTLARFSEQRGGRALLGRGEVEVVENELVLEGAPRDLFVEREERVAPRLRCPRGGGEDAGRCDVARLALEGGPQGDEPGL